MTKPEVRYLKAQSRIGINQATGGPSQIYTVAKDNPITDDLYVLADKLTFKFYGQHKVPCSIEELNPAPAKMLTVTEIDPTTPLAVQLIEQGIDQLTLEDIAIYLHNENYIQNT